MYEEWYRSHDHQADKAKQGTAVGASSSLRSYDDWVGIILERSSALLNHIHGEDRVAFERVLTKFLIDLPLLSDSVLETYIKMHSSETEG